jgi:hypothetical protein
MATCGRAGCDKKLRSNNTKGVCGSGCLSSSAPPAVRAKEAGKASSGSLPATSTATGDVLDRFDKVCAALGKDPQETLSELAQGWLDEVRDIIDGKAVAG